ncbi:MAG: hypothetical protein M0Q46_05500 [Endomicrobiales bacterium]|nr:hypothetical protein [Endomicrobiales bacterium]
MKINKALILSSLLISLIFLSSSICNAAFISSAPVAMNGSVSVTAISDVLDNFDSMSGVNNWGGQYGQLNTGSGRSVNISYDETAHPGNNACLKVVYSVTNSGEWAGMSIGLANSSSASRDISKYRAISFDIKGVDLGQSFKIEWKNTNQSTTSKVYLSDYLDRTSGSNGGTGTSWETVTIPLDAFANFSSTNNLKDLGYINFIFEHDYLNTNGMLFGTTFYIDNIVFSTTAPNAVRIDSFGDAWGSNALGGNNGAWAADPATCSESYDTTTSSGAVRSWKVVYFTSSSYCGTFALFGGGVDGTVEVPHDFSQYSTLRFRVRANSDAENPKTFKVGLVDASGVERAIVPTNVTTSWKEYYADFPTYFPSLDKTTIKKFTTVFENWRVDGAGGSRAGIVYFDDIRFEK